MFNDEAIAQTRKVLAENGASAGEQSIVQLLMLLGNVTERLCVAIETNNNLMREAQRPRVFLPGEA